MLNYVNSFLLNFLREHRPPENPADYHQFLGFNLFPCVFLIRELIPVEAANSDAGRGSVELLDPELSGMTYRVEITVCDGPISTINPNGCSIFRMGSMLLPLIGTQTAFAGSTLCRLRLCFPNRSFA